MEDSYQAMLQEISEVKEEKRGELTIGISHTRGRLILPKVLPEFMEQYPLIEVHILEGNTCLLYTSSSRSYVEVQLRTKEMDDVAEIGSANHRLYEKAQEKDRSRREAIPEGECRYFDDAYERGMKLLNLQMKDLDVNMFAATDNIHVNDGCGLYRGRLILPYEHLSRFQTDSEE